MQPWASDLASLSSWLVQLKRFFLSTFYFHFALGQAFLLSQIYIIPTGVKNPSGGGFLGHKESDSQASHHLKKISPAFVPILFLGTVLFAGMTQCGNIYSDGKLSINKVASGI